MTDIVLCKKPADPIVPCHRSRYDPVVMIFSRKNAGKWVASKSGKMLAADTRLSNVLKKVKGHKKDDIRLDLVPRTPYLAG